MNNNSSKTAGRQWRMRLAAISLGLMTAAIIGEVAVRIIVPPECVYVFDPYVGHRFVPGEVFLHHKEGRIWVRINSQALRDREHIVTKPNGVYRIAVLGDSFAEALQVEQHEAFWSVLESRLSDADVLKGRSIEVINFGVSGYGTVHEWQMLKHYARDYLPDLVLLAFFPGNDVRNNTPSLESQVGTPFATIENGALKFDPIANPIPPGSWLWFKDSCIRSFRLVQLAHQLKERIGSQRQVAAPTSPGEQGLDCNAFAPPRDAAWIEGWEMTRLALQATQLEAHRQEAKFLVVVLTNPAQVSLDPDAELSMKKFLNLDNLDYADRRLDEIAGEFNFPIIHLTPEFRDRARSEKIWFHGFPQTRLGTGHWNRDGHYFAGEILSRELARLIPRWQGQDNHPSEGEPRNDQIKQAHP